MKGKGRDKKRGRVMKGKGYEGDGYDREGI
jgi:hypothetical protein